MYGYFYALPLIILINVFLKFMFCEELSYIVHAYAFNKGLFNFLR